MEMPSFFISLDLILKVRLYQEKTLIRNMLSERVRESTKTTADNAELTQVWLTSYTLAPGFRLGLPIDET
jgi:hypothetical protein